MASGTIQNYAKKRSLGTAVNIIGYTSTEYTAPSDGYVRLSCTARTQAFITLYVDGAYMLRAMGVDNAQADLVALFVHKGAKLKVAYDGLGVTHEASFIPLV